MAKAWIIGKNEIKTALRDKVFIIITLLFLILSVISVYIGAITKSVEIQTYHQVIESLKAVGSTNFPEKPIISSMSILQNIVMYISIVGAVMAIFLGFDGISRERSQGTLKLMLSRPIYRDQLISGKLLGAASIISTVLVMTFIGNLLLFYLITGMQPTSSDMLRLFIVLFFGFIYMMSFYIASLYFSLRSSNKSFSFLLMMIIWLTVSFVIPQLADSQRAFTYNMNANTQAVTKLAMDTNISNLIEIFSPTVHFEHLSYDLLQVNIQTIKLSIFEILQQRSIEIIYMLVPGILLLVASFLRFLREEEDNR